MKRSFLIICISLFVVVGWISASPLDDLASPDQGSRDKAAAELRASYQEIPQSKWQPTLDGIHKCHTKSEVMDLLKPFNVKPEMGFGSGQSHSESYRLDEGWLLTCWYENKGDVLMEGKLNQSIKNVWVYPPKNFTGKWITYFVNGQKSHEIDYKNGQYFGEFIAYHANGNQCGVQHYNESGIDGEEIGYHPSGHLANHGWYKAGERFGKVTFYDDEGNISSTNEDAGLYTYNVTFSQPDIKTPHGILFCNGQSLPVAFGQVITPLGEYIGVKNGGIGEWKAVDQGKFVGGVGSANASAEVYITGDFEHPPKNIGSGWFYLVKKGLWVNPKKWTQVNLDTTPLKSE